MQYSSLSNYPTQQHSPALGLPGPPHRIQTNTYGADIPGPLHLPMSSSSSPVNYGLYASTSRASFTQPLIGVSAFTNWSASASSSLLPSATPSVSSALQSRPSSNTGPTLHSPLTAQVYSSDPGVLRTQTGLDMGETGPYSLSQQSPDQMLPECASTEPSKFLASYNVLVTCIYKVQEVYTFR